MKMKKKTLDIIVEVVDEWVCSEDVACMIRMIMKKRDYERVEHEYDPYEYSRRATRYVRY